MSRFPILGLRSVDFEVPDLDAALRFYMDAWGLSLVERDGARAWLHATGDDAYVLALRAGRRACIHDVTFRARSEADLARLAERVSAAGLTIVRPVGAIIDDPAGGRGFAFLDKRGRNFRIVHGDRKRKGDPDILSLPNRLSHININSRDVDDDIAFFTDVLGFRLTDRSKAMGFVRTNEDHHSVVISEGPSDTLNHVAFNHSGWEGVMRAAGRLVDHRCAVGWGPGRHGPGNNVFAYFVDPFGFVVEQTAEVLQVDDDYVVRGPAEWAWPPGRVDHWGIAPAKSLACKEAQLAIRFVGQDEVYRPRHVV